MRLPALFTALLCMPLVGHAQLRLPKALAPHMVLQQDSTVTLWGWATPGAAITVAADWPGAAPDTAQTDTDGRWIAHLRTPAALPGDPAYTLRFQCDAGEVIELDDVLVGEVWLLSGQSNMELPLRGWPDSSPPAPIEGGPEAIASAHHPRIRLFAVGRQSSATPQEEIADYWSTPRWTPCNPDTAAGFSAVGIFFATELQSHLSVPIGLIQSAWGGSAGEAWVPAEDLAKLKDFADQGPWEPKNAEDNQSPSVLYNGMIAPLRPYTIRGVLWYQGETNVGRHETYARLIPELVVAWRREFQNPDMPFFGVQLAPWDGYGPTSLQEMWEAQRAGLALPHTGIVTTIDLGNAANIHPGKKQPVGYRLALLARQQVYGETDLVADGPTYAAHSFDGPRCIVRFSSVGGGLVVPENQYCGFELAGADGVFHPAKVVVNGGDHLVLTTSTVSVPIQARYAWTPTPVPTLFNREGLPAAPFRTEIP